MIYLSNISLCQEEEEKAALGTLTSISINTSEFKLGLAVGLGYCSGLGFSVVEGINLSKVEL